MQWHGTDMHRIDIQVHVIVLKAASNLKHIGKHLKHHQASYANIHNYKLGFGGYQIYSTAYACSALSCVPLLERACEVEVFKDQGHLHNMRHPLLCHHRRNATFVAKHGG